MSTAHASASTAGEAQKPTCYGSGDSHPDSNAIEFHLQKIQELVDANHHEVTNDVVRAAQRLVSNMQKVLGGPTVPHRELEEDYKRECEKLQPKIKDHTVTIEEANHLHSLETRAHGHTDKGGPAAIAMSIATKMEHLHIEEAKLEPKIESGTITQEEADHLHSLEARALGHTPKGGLAAHAQSVAAKAGHLHEEHAKVMPKVEAGTVEKDEANRLQSAEVRAQGNAEKGGAAAQAQSVADKKENSATDNTASDKNTAEHIKNGSEATDGKEAVATA